MKIGDSVRKFLLQIATEWTRGSKHPETPSIVFKNVWMTDSIRSRTRSRCQVCDHAVSDEPMQRGEVLFICEKGKCLCPEKATGVVGHTVCDLCAAMFRSLYVNWGLKSRDYFRKLDDAENVKPPRTWGRLD
jgi:hypothetical protein